MPDAEAARDDSFSLLLVCTGNICRSPVAERLLAVEFEAGVTVSSAGTHALVGEPISAPMVALIQAVGADSQHFHARRLTEQMPRSADLVLAMTRGHRAAVVEVWPAAVRRTFTLLEFARLLAEVNAADLPDGSDANRLRAAIPLAAAQRGRLRLAAADFDIADPYRRSDAHYAAAFAQIKGSVDTITRIVTQRNSASQPD